MFLWSLFFFFPFLSFSFSFLFFFTFPAFLVISFNCALAFKRCIVSYHPYRGFSVAICLVAEVQVMCQRSYSISYLQA